ncbi:MAG: ATP synthase F1 subunit delta [Candidatus Moranbacteria bacterium]|nr:ATP synthase F1 subunit delta [Candidatus Moranbacteria bacterium]
MKISIKQYSQTLFDLTDGKSEQDVLAVLKNFAEQLKRDGQLKNAGKIMEKFSDLHDAANGMVVAEVVVSKEIATDELEKVREFVAKKYAAKEVELKIVIDEKIQGGIVIRVGDEVIDGSVAMQLKRLKNILSK